MIVSVSNNKGIDSFIIDDSIPMRVKQASSVTAEEAFSALQKSVANKIKMCAQSNHVLSTKWKGDFGIVVTTPRNHADMLSQLAILDDALNSELTASLSANHRASMLEFYDFVSEIAGLSAGYYDY